MILTEKHEFLVILAKRVGSSRVQVLQRAYSIY